jgi:hypothetical protein
VIERLPDRVLTGTAGRAAEDCAISSHRPIACYRCNWRLGEHRADYPRFLQEGKKSPELLALL